MWGYFVYYSDMQFGYKPNHSTTSCTTVLKEIIKYYLRGNSNVYCCLPSKQCRRRFH